MDVCTSGDGTSFPHQLDAAAAEMRRAPTPEVLGARPLGLRETAGHEGGGAGREAIEHTLQAGCISNQCQLMSAGIQEGPIRGFAFALTLDRRSPVHTVRIYLLHMLASRY